jgi:hypothetical protein
VGLVVSASSYTYSSEELGRMWKQASWMEKRPFIEGDAQPTVLLFFPR